MWLDLSCFRSDGQMCIYFQPWKQSGNRNLATECPPGPVPHSVWWSGLQLPCCTASRTSAGPSWWSSCDPAWSLPRWRADKTRRMIFSLWILCIPSYDLLHAFLPDVKRNGHHCVQNNDVGPKRKEGWEQEVVHRRVPGKEALKQEAHFFLPYCVADSQDPPHTH